MLMCFEVMSMDVEKQKLEQFIGRMMPVLNEKQRRLFLGCMADCLGRGAVALLHNLTKVSRVTINHGRDEAAELIEDPTARPRVSELEQTRRPGAGHKSIVEKYPTIKEELMALVDGSTIGNPENPLCWTTKSLRHLEKELKNKGFDVSFSTIQDLLADMGFSLQQNQKYISSAVHPDRNEQFEYINSSVKDFIARGQPVISVDTKKKELVGNFKNAGAEYRPCGLPLKVMDHDFKTKDTQRAVPYGIYDIERNEGYVNVGISHDTAEFAVQSIRQWWEQMGRPVYPDAKELLITADGGGSNGWRCRLWKTELQKFADDSGLSIKVCHFSPGSSKWNKIEHRMFAFISKNWRGHPLETLAVIVSLIGSVRTDKGLKIQCDSDEREYEKGVKVSEEEYSAVNIQPDSWHGEWNYTISPKQ